MRDSLAWLLTHQRPFRPLGIFPGWQCLLPATMRVQGDTAHVTDVAGSFDCEVSGLLDLSAYYDEDELWKT